MQNNIINKLPVLVSLFLVLSFFTQNIQAQKKYKFKKLPKNLLNSWVMDFHVFRGLLRGQEPVWEGYNKIRMKIEKTRILIDEEDDYWEGSWRFFELMEIFEDFDTDYIEEREWIPEYTEERDTKEGEFLIIEHFPMNAKEGNIILKKIENEYNYFYILTYKIIDKDNLQVSMFYDLYNLEEAQYASKKLKNIEKSRYFISKKLFDKYNNYPTMPAENEIVYYKWWDDYLNKIKELTYAPSISIFTGTYNDAFLRQQIYLENGYNPYTSDESLKKSVVKFGFNRQVKEKIRGEIDQKAFEQNIQLLQNTWISHRYFSFIVPVRKISKLTFLADTLEISIKEEIEDWNKYEASEYLNYVNNLEVKLPILNIVPLMNEKEGIIVLGPLPPFLQEEGKGIYTTMGFRKKNDNEFYFNNRYNFDFFKTAERASNANLYNVELESQPLFINQEKHQFYQSLPLPPQMTEEEAIKLKEKYREYLYDPETESTLLF